jgi:hypothetical protein
MTVDLLAAVRRGRRGCGEGIKGRCVLRAVSWWPWRRLLALGERMGDWAAQEWSAHARMGRLADGAGRLGKKMRVALLYFSSFYYFLLFLLRFIHKKELQIK